MFGVQFLKDVDGMLSYNISGMTEAFNEKDQNVSPVLSLNEIIGLRKWIMVNIDSDLNPHCNQQCNLYYSYYFPLIYFCYQCVMKAY